MPDNMTHFELGALLHAVGKLMMRDGTCVGATLDGNVDDDLVELMADQGVGEERARTIIKTELDEDVLHGSVD